MEKQYGKQRKSKENSWNEGLVIEDATGNQFVWVPVNAEINEDIQYKLDNNLELTMEEIELVIRRKAWSTNPSIKYRNIISSSIHRTICKRIRRRTRRIHKNDNKCIKNGGFYVGRYEAGTETARTTATAEKSTLLSKPNVYPYNFIAWGSTMNDTDKFNESNKKQQNY